MKTINNDKEWKILDKVICRVIKFDMFSLVKEEKIIETNSYEPYAYLFIECKKFTGQIRVAITHKVDFLNLREAFQEIKDDEEILIVWNKSDIKFWAKLLSIFMPKLIVWRCHKDAYELIHDIDYKPELKGEERFLAEAPIREWKPLSIK